MSVGQILGVLTTVFVLGALFSNGLIMLISPARWFKLPSYVAFRGSLRERDYLGKVSGRFQIRATGLAIVGVTIYLVSEWFGFNLHFLRAIGSQSNALILRSGRWVCLVTCLAVIGCGFVMLLKPKWWVVKYMSAGETEEDRTILLERIVRIMSLPIFVVGAYFLYQCAAVR
jgi:hypothetical protein